VEPAVSGSVKDEGAWAPPATGTAGNNAALLLAARRLQQQKTENMTDGIPPSRHA
jgi:hypothetical protein